MICEQRCCLQDHLVKMHAHVASYTVQDAIDVRMCLGAGMPALTLLSHGLHDQQLNETVKQLAVS